MVYKNSIAVASGSASGVMSPGDAFYVAGWNAASPYDTDVVVDDVRVFDRALTLAQVNAAMAAPVV